MPISTHCVYSTYYIFSLKEGIESELHAYIHARTVRKCLQYTVYANICSLKAGIDSNLATWL